MPPLAAAAVGLAFLLDFGLREFPAQLHPVVGYGAILELLDRKWAHHHVVAAVIAIAMPLGAATVIGALTWLTGSLHPALGVVTAGGVLFASTSRRLLIEIANDVIELSSTDPAAARERLPALVGRDPDALTDGEIRSAAVESAAENLADGLIGPLLAFVLFAWSLPIAAGAAFFVKAVNTGDSMFGYRSHPLGWPFARLDDVVMWLPARVTAVLIAVVAGQPAALHTAGQWARSPSSPNAGWPMATLAAALDSKLEKPGAYTLNPAAALPTATKAQQGIRLISRTSLVAFAGATVVAWY